MALTAQQFDQGMTTQEYLDQIQTNREAILDIFNSVKVPEEDQAFFDALSGPLRLAVFTEDWCPDGVTSTPSLLRLADASDGLTVKVFKRDQVLEVANSFLPGHRQGTLPVFVVFDAEMLEIGRFIEAAKELLPAKARMEEETLQAMSAPSDVGKPLGEMSEASRNAIRRARMAFRVDHAREWGEIIIHAFTALVKQGLALPPEQRPSEGGTEWPAP
jgi:hypothetical protein